MIFVIWTHPLMLSVVHVPTSQRYCDHCNRRSVLQKNKLNQNIDFYAHHISKDTIIWSEQAGFDRMPWHGYIYTKVRCKAAIVHVINDARNRVNECSTTIILYSYNYSPDFYVHKNMKFSVNQSAFMNKIFFLFSAAMSSTDISVGYGKVLMNLFFK